LDETDLVTAYQIFSGGVQEVIADFQKTSPLLRF